MKKIISAITIATMLLGITSFAAQNPTVTLNGSQIVFADQEPIIKDDRTLVPARGVFEAMGARVTWLEKERRVQIDSSDNFTRVYLTIDSDNMEIYKFKDIFSSDREDKTLDVAAQIINDRTMIPLRAVSEAFECDVKWDDVARNVIITTKDGANEIGEETTTPYVYLSTEASDVAKDQEFDVYVNMKNFKKELAMTNGAVAIEYDKSAFEVISSTMCFGEYVLTSNPNALEKYLVCAFATGSRENKAKDGAYLKITFKALNDEGGEISLSTFYETRRGYITNVGMYDTEADYTASYNPLNMGVDTTPIVVK